MDPSATRCNPEMAPVGFSVVILNLQIKTGMMFLIYFCLFHTCEVQLLHGHFVLSRPSVRYEGETPGGSVVKRHADTPQVHAHAVGFLMRLTQHGAFVHVWMLHTHITANTLQSSINAAWGRARGHF